MRRRILPVTSVVALLGLPAVGLAARGGTGMARRAAPGIATARRAAPGIATARRAAPGIATARRGHGPVVSVRVEGLKKTRLLATLISGRRGWITKGGTPRGQCSGKSAAGALDVATRRDWAGSWSAKYQALSVIGILGERHTFKSPDYWSVWVNDKYASSGVCGIPLKHGEQLLFAAEPESTTWYPTVLGAPRSATANHSFTVKLADYGSSGKKPLAGATITGNGITPVKTDHSGVATITDGHPGMLVLRTSPRGFVRTEAVVHVG